MVLKSSTDPVLAADTDMPMFDPVFTGSTGITPRLQLAQYSSSCKNSLASDFSTWVITIWLNRLNPNSYQQEILNSIASASSQFYEIVLTEIIEP